MRKRGIKLTDYQARFIIWLVLFLSIALTLESGYLIYLKFSKYTAKVEIVEVPPVVIKTPEEIGTSKNPSTSNQIKFFKLDYREMINSSLEYLEHDATVSIYMLDKKGVERALGACSNPFFLTQVSTGLYSLLLTQDCTQVSRIPQRTAYGIYLLAVSSEGFARAKMLDLREIGLPAFVVHFVKNGKDYYSTVIGAFPSPGVARTFMEKLDWDWILSQTNLRERGYVGCVINCGE